MERTNKDKVLKYIFLILSLTCWVTFGSLCILMLAFFNMWLLIISILCFVLFIVFARFSRLKYLGYQLKYYYCNKKYNQEIVGVLKKFEGAPQEFIDNLRRRTKITYRYAGYLFSRDEIDSIYKEKQSKDIITTLYTELYKSILSKGGFIEFFKQIESLNKDSWEINHYISTNLISNELDYLLNEVYCLTDYTIYDNGLSEEFTIRNNKMIEDLNNIYSPLLFNFEDELEQVVNKLKEQ